MVQKFNTSSSPAPVGGTNGGSGDGVIKLVLVFFGLSIGGYLYNKYILEPKKLKKKEENKE